MQLINFPSLDEALKASNKKIDELDWLVPHQANQRIILAVADKMKMMLVRLFLQ